MGALADRGQPGQRERRVAAVVPPGLEVVADRDAVQAAPRRDRELDQLAWRELLGGCLVSDPEIHVTTSYR